MISQAGACMSFFDIFRWQPHGEKLRFSRAKVAGARNRRTNWQLSQANNETGFTLAQVAEMGAGSEPVEPEAQGPVIVDLGFCEVRGELQCRHCMGQGTPCLFSTRTKEGP
jgi:hypothetical protein